MKRPETIKWQEPSRPFWVNTEKGRTMKKVMTIAVIGFALAMSARAEFTYLTSHHMVDEMRLDNGAEN